MAYQYSTGENAYVGSKRDTKPTGKLDDRLIEVDAKLGTKTLYIHDGNTWALQGTSESYEEQCVDIVARALIKNVSNFLYNSPKEKVPNPVTMEYELVSLTTKGVMYIAWMEEDGTLWGLRSPYKIVKSVDYGDNWTEVVDVTPFLNTDETPSLKTMIVSDTGRIILGTNQGRVLVSDTAKTTFTAAFTFASGESRLEWGWNKYKNIILLSSYGNNATTPPCEVIMSLDHGATFKRIFNKDTSSVVDKEHFHIHSTLYDPYADVIYVVTGDFEERQIYASWNLGNDWIPTIENPDDGYPSIHPTQMIATPYGITLGSDEIPEGIRLWRRPDKIQRPIMMEKEIDMDFITWSLPTDTMIASLSVSGWFTQFDDGSFTAILPFRVDTASLNKNGHSRLFATCDGKHWYKIYEEARTDVKGFYNVLGPCKNDPQRRVIATYSIDGGIKMFRGKLPAFG